MTGRIETIRASLADIGPPDSRTVPTGNMYAATKALLADARSDLAFLLERVARVEAWVDASPGIDGAEEVLGILHEDEDEEVAERIDAHLRRPR
ncbi:MAG: hypothetical protein IT379_37370 [Deltaproteobacteria bacterium]|nr:hypothetical protein [Deltaproteobacteria bacterium]